MSTAASSIKGFKPSLFALLTYFTLIASIYLLQRSLYDARVVELLRSSVLISIPLSALVFLLRLLPELHARGTVLVDCGQVVSNWLSGSTFGSVFIGLRNTWTVFAIQLAFVSFLCIAGGVPPQKLKVLFDPSGVFGLFAFCTGALVIEVFSRGHVYACENGLWTGLQLIHWSDIHSYRWIENDASVLELEHTSPSSFNPTNLSKRERIPIAKGQQELLSQILLKKQNAS